VIEKNKYKNKSYKMTAHLPLHLTLTFWCMLDMGINAFILANLILCQELISEGMFTPDSSYPYPTIHPVLG
jgi:hypothetical protein